MLINILVSMVKLGRGKNFAQGSVSGVCGGGGGGSGFTVGTSVCIYSYT